MRAPRNQKINNFHLGMRGQGALTEKNREHPPPVTAASSRSSYTFSIAQVYRFHHSARLSLSVFCARVRTVYLNPCCAITRPTPATSTCKRRIATSQSTRHNHSATLIAATVPRPRHRLTPSVTTPVDNRLIPQPQRAPYSHAASHRLAASIPQSPAEHHREQRKHRHAHGAIPATWMNSQARSTLAATSIDMPAAASSRLSANRCAT